MLLPLDFAHSIRHHLRRTSIAATLLTTLSLAPATASAATVNCFLTVPPEPLSAIGLATPYQLSGPGCHEANAGTAAFVEATILDPGSGALFTYKPIVVDAGTTPAVPPLVPLLPVGGVVGIGIGFNGDNLTLLDSGGSLSQGRCVNGLGPSIFGQVSFCNNEAFFGAANAAIESGVIHVPQRGTAADGQVCPSTWSWNVVDMDPVDNTDTRYLVVNGKIAQDTQTNRTLFPNATVLRNPGDFLYTDQFLDPAVGCQPWQVRDLSDPLGGTSPSQQLDELQARFTQSQDGSNALLVDGDEMVLVNGQLNLDKTNAYRVNVDQPTASTLADANTAPYCRGMLQIGLPHVVADKAFLEAAPPIDPAVANNFYTFTAVRFQQAFGPDFLNCTGLLHVQNPVTVTTDSNGVAIAATINLHPASTARLSS
ncbi:MAG: hypothetical protein JO020_28140 [Chloroflexi bacterium]|nr:hypothetical protein [Chloroflexota bacterium]MBV9898044.1 hypothetical protein [Chloroflexota bacterium]